jgi:hypothetical protein
MGADIRCVIGRSIVYIQDNHTGDKYISRLIWNHEQPYDTFSTLSRHRISSQFNRYGVEYSNQRDDGAYIRFERKNGDKEKKIVVGPKILNDQWIWSGFWACDEQKYDADASRCSLLAPFDNEMHINIGMVVNNMCGIGENPADHAIFDRGIEMEIERIDIYALYFDKCPN